MSMNVSMLRNLKMMCPYEGKMLSKNEIAKMSRDIPKSNSTNSPKLNDLKIKDSYVGQRYTGTPEHIASGMPNMTKSINYLI